MNWLIDFLERNQMACFWKSSMGIECPGCGMQSSFIELLKGNILESILIYPALIPMIATLVLMLVQIFFKFRHTLFYLKISIIFTVSLMIINFFYKLFFL
jgi:hypothetical protein